MGEGGEGHTIPFCRAGSGMGLGSVLWSKEKPAGGAGRTPKCRGAAGGGPFGSRRLCASFQPPHLE